nr:MAG: hypothetical protein H3RhizoLitter137666_000002 [Mitovirus sp.]
MLFSFLLATLTPFLIRAYVEPKDLLCNSDEVVVTRR